MAMATGKGTPRDVTASKNVMAIEKGKKLPLTPNNPQGYSLLKFYYSAFFLSTFLLSTWHYGIPSHLIRLSPSNQELANLPPTIAKATWQWTDIEPSSDLIWHSCYQTFQCARLSLPLDYLNLSNPSLISLAIIKIPATDLTSYLGPVFTNPGGPGGSGIYSLLKNGHNLQKIIGKNHDLISFDPRGIGASVPLITCFASEQNAQLWKLADVGTVDSHPGVLYDAFARASVLSRTCEENMEREAKASGEGNESLLRYVSTTNVARDMLEIMTKTGSEKLRYWGFSYGTFLGGVFAAMYPERVERMVSDGNVDYREWSTNTHISFLHDSDKIMSAFYHYCHASGPTACAFYSPTPIQIQTRLRSLLSTLKTHPIPVLPTDPLSLPELITYTSLQRLISASLYRPILLFPLLAQVLLSLETGDGLPFLNLISTYGMRESFTCSCDLDSCSLPSPPWEDLEATDDAMAAIMCSDGGVLNETVEEFGVYSQKLISSSHAAGAVNVEIRLSCIGRSITPNWRFTGPFKGNTSHPILYLANFADNVTPLRSALANAEGFLGSRVLVQNNSYGHTSLSAPSVCTARAIRRYFQKGEMPEVGTVCEADAVPFGGGGGTEEVEYREEGIDRASEDLELESDGDGEGESEMEMDIDRELKEAGWNLMLNADIGYGWFRKKVDLRRRMDLKDLLVFA